MGLALVRGLFIVGPLIESLEAVAGVSPEDKATIVAAVISEVLSATMRGAILEIPLLLVAWFIDRALRRSDRT